jgi:hypothetical protein
MFDIFVFSLREYEYIVEVRDNEVVKVFLQNGKDKSLKRYRCVSESE